MDLRKGLAGELRGGCRLLLDIVSLLYTERHEIEGVCKCQWVL